MKGFEFISVPRIVFGRGQFNRIGELAVPFGSRALVVHYGSESRARARMDEPLVKAGIAATYRQQSGEPCVTDVDQGVQQARGEKIDFLIAIGGGSAIDCAKAIAGLLTNGGSVIDYMEVIGKGQKITRPSAPWIAIPTTAGTGAEATRNAVIGSPDKHFKASLRSEHLLPRIALIDPELAVDVPPHVTAASGMDALCQLIESYTSLGAGPMTDPLALQGITLASRSLRRAFGNGHDLDAREDMAMAALLSGITLTNAGLGAVHGFAAPLGANFPAPHGAICAILLPLVLQANIQTLRQQQPNHPVLDRYAAIGRIMAGQHDLPAEQAQEFAIQYTRDLAREMKIPSLKQFGFKESDIDPVVELAGKSSSMKYNPVFLPRDVLPDILHKAIWF